MTCERCTKPITAGEEFETHHVERGSRPAVTIHVHKRYCTRRLR